MDQTRGILGRLIGGGIVACTEEKYDENYTGGKTPNSMNGHDLNSLSVVKLQDNPNEF
jgi:hypothetical protein